MNMKRLLFPVLLASALLATRCADDKDDTPSCPIAKADALGARGGYLRAEIRLRLSDPLTRRVALYWFPSNTDTVWIDTPTVDPNAELSVAIGEGTSYPIDEGNYRLKAVSFGAGQERSEICFARMNVYGDNYIQQLANRPAEVVTEGTSAMTVTFGDPVDEREVGVEIAYTNNEGVAQVRTFANDELAEPVRIEADLLELATYRSVYLPEPEALDRLKAAPHKIAGYANVNVAQGKKATCSDWFMSFTADKAVDGIDLVDASRWVNNVAAGEHWLQIDLGEVCAINSYQLSMGTNGANVGTKTPAYEFQAEVGGEWVTLDAQADALDALHKCSFPQSVATSKVRLYIPDGNWTDKLRLYEIQVFALI